MRLTVRFPILAQATVLMATGSAPVESTVKRETGASNWEVQSGRPIGAYAAEFDPLK